MEFIEEPMSPQAAVEAGRLNTNNWDELLQLQEVLTFNAEKLKTINAKAQAEMTADDVITWKEFVNTAARHFPEFIDAEKAGGLSANMHFVIGGGEKKMSEFTLKIENGEATYTDGLQGEPSSVTAMDAETFISTISYSRKDSTGDLELSDSELEGIAGGKGNVTSGSGACGADSCGGVACGAAACGAVTVGVGACGADACGAAFCGIVLTGADACAADACGIDVIPGVPGI